MPYPIDRDLFRLGSELNALANNAFVVWNSLMDAWASLHSDIAMLSNGTDVQLKELLAGNYPLDTSGTMEGKKKVNSIWSDSHLLYYGSMKDIHGQLEILTRIPLIQNSRQAVLRLPLIRGALDTIQNNGKQGIYGEVWIVNGTSDGTEKLPDLSTTLNDIQSALEMVIPKKQDQYQVAAKQIKESLEAFGNTIFPQLEDKERVLLQLATPKIEGLRYERSRITSASKTSTSELCSMVPSVFTGAPTAHTHSSEIPTHRRQELTDGSLDVIGSASIRPISSVGQTNSRFTDSSNQFTNNGSFRQFTAAGTESTVRNRK
ncbi:hypothetical protein QFC24_006327 [Naganishia onofrii]|uniref:Uncharacterized protein n=1 Tax=Naganishia onofrii TaxID=1851511 RepID=A0ACC2X388_9TREE|nr:hypothetical protein QFC24_006327 [Naganishia onofrii]